MSYLALLNIYTQISYTGVFAQKLNYRILNHYSYDIQGQAHGYLFSQHSVN